MVTHIKQPSAGNGFVGMVGLDGYVAIGADGYIVAATSVLPEGVTVTHLGNQTGLYVVASDETFVNLFPVVQFDAGVGVALDAQTTGVSGSGFTVRLVNGSGVATTPSAACGFFFNIEAKMSLVK